MCAAVGWTACARTAAACELCRALGTAALPSSHGGAIGGDDLNDAILPPLPPPTDDGDPIAQFVLQGGKWPQPGGLRSPVMLTYSFENMFDGGLKMPNGDPLPADLIRGSIEEALGLWASVAPLHFVEVEDDGLPYGSGASQYGQLRFRHKYLNGPDPQIGDPSAKAQAYFPNTVGVTPGDVEFDDSDRWQEFGTLRQPDVLGAAIHEIGHTLGLSHSTGTRPNEYWTYQVYDAMNQIVDVQTPKGDANMFWIFTRYTGLGTGQLFSDDIAGIRAIYGEGVGRVTPLPAPEPTTWFLALVAAMIWTCRARWHRC